jgi:hypothetical protein
VRRRPGGWLVKTFQATAFALNFRSYLGGSLMFFRCSKL